MKVKVKKVFRDKYTRKIHELGETFTCNKKRVDEIMSVDQELIEVIEEPKKKAESKEDATEK